MNRELTRREKILLLVLIVFSIGRVAAPATGMPLMESTTI